MDGESERMPFFVALNRNVVKYSMNFEKMRVVLRLMTMRKKEKTNSWTKISSKKMEEQFIWAIAGVLIHV